MTVLRDVMITDDRSYYPFYGAIDAAEPSSVLDAAGFLVRTAAVSRRMYDITVPGNVRLDLVNSFQALPPVTEKIYDQILTRESLLRYSGPPYDLCIFLAPDPLFDTEEELREMLHALLRCSRLISTDRGIFRTDEYKDLYLHP